MTCPTAAGSIGTVVFNAAQSPDAIHAGQVARFEIVAIIGCCVLLWPPIPLPTLERTA
jgi:hypothetical protein